MQKNSIVMTLIFLLLLFYVSCEKKVVYASDVSDLNGTWMDNRSYKYMTTHLNEKVEFEKKEFSWGMAKYLVDSMFRIDISSDKPFIYPCDFGIGAFAVGRVEKKTSDVIKLYVYREDEPGMRWDLSFTFHFIDRDTVWVEYENINGTNGVYDNGTYWHRISGSAAMPIQAGEIIDDRVRLRVKPNLKSDTFCFLNNEEKIAIIDKCTNKEKIGDMENYWYKVQVDGKPDGWVYGAYINVTE
jgi:hypothetical protein